MVMQSVVMAQLFGGGGGSSGTFLSLIPFALIFVISISWSFYRNRNARNSRRRCWRH